MCNVNNDQHLFNSIFKIIKTDDYENEFHEKSYGTYFDKLYLSFYLS